MPTLPKEHQDGESYNRERSTDRHAEISSLKEQQPGIVAVADELLVQVGELTSDHTRTRLLRQVHGGG